MLAGLYFFTFSPSFLLVGWNVRFSMPCSLEGGCLVVGGAYQITQFPQVRYCMLSSGVEYGPLWTEPCGFPFKNLFCHEETPLLQPVIYYQILSYLKTDTEESSNSFERSGKTPDSSFILYNRCRRPSPTASAYNSNQAVCMYLCLF